MPPPAGGPPSGSRRRPPAGVPDLRLETVDVNGAPAVVVRSAGVGMVVVLNPEQLTALDAPRDVAVR